VSVWAAFRKVSHNYITRGSTCTSAFCHTKRADLADTNTNTSVTKTNQDLVFDVGKYLAPVFVRRCKFLMRKTRRIPLQYIAGYSKSASKSFAAS
jgi:hypothetical protein